MMSMDAIKLHWRAPLQTKGFLKIIEFVLAILTFSLVAGFHVQGYIRCDDKKSDNALVVDFSYPFSSYSYHNGTTKVSLPFPYQQAQGSSQFIVAWGVLSMFYCIIALTVYILFTANERLELLVDLLVYLDLGFHLLWVFLWFIACIAWSVAFNGMQSKIKPLVLDNIMYVPACGNNTHDYSTHQGTYEQAAVGAVFGFFSFFLWTANIYWVAIDTAFYIQWKARREAFSYTGNM